MPTIGIRLNTELHHNLQDASEEEHISISDFVRRAVAHELSGHLTPSNNVEHESRIAHLEQQAHEKDDHTRELHQLLGVAQKNVASLTEQNQLLLTDNRKPSWWERLTQRPRLAWETAYVGAFVLWVAFSIPVPAVRAMPGKALSLLSSNPVEELREPTSQLSRDVWGATGAKSVDTARNVKTGIVERYSRTDDARSDLRRHGADLGDAVKSLDLDGSLDAVNGIRKGAGSVWRRFTGRHDETNGAGSDPGAC